MNKPNRIGMYPLGGVDNPQLLVAWDKNGKVMAEFEIKDGSKAPFIKTAMNNKIKTGNSSQDFWNSWEKHAKKNRI